MNDEKRGPSTKQGCPIQKSRGTTRTEKLLASLCESSFLRLWSYANPYKDDGHELCDLLAVFQNHVFVFFDREKAPSFEDGTEPQVAWDRWKRRAIAKQIATAHGAVRYLQSGRGIFLDAKTDTAFPLSFDRNGSDYHKIIVAHGMEEVVKNASPDNVNGSLAISYGDAKSDLGMPFVVHVDRSKPVHVLDSFTLPIILGELDTIFDLSEYFAAKERAIQSFNGIYYCGEEDLLAHYFSNFDDDSNRHFIGTKDRSINGLLIAEGGWSDFVESEIYKRTKAANKNSYLWDEIIQHTCENALQGVLISNGDVFKDRSAIEVMAREPRFSRRVLSEAIGSAIKALPYSSESIRRYVSLLPSYYDDQAYVFLQLWVPYDERDSEYRGKRQRILEIACGAAKLARPELKTIVGIAIDAPRHARENGEDFLLMPCEDWTDEQSSKYRELNKPFRFFSTPQLRITEKSASEFVHD